jgi:hypothetical protein
LCTATNPISIAYQNGVPMGDQLHNAPPGTPPSFLVIAQKDPLGVGVAKIQLIKGWSDGGVAHEKVFVVGQSGEPDGSSMMCVLWTDPEFSSSHPAFYYARVMEVPTLRWSTHDCRAVAVDCQSGVTLPPEYAACCDGSVPETIQERAWASPIWYLP